MKFKLDENLGKSALELLVQAGHDVDNVLQEGLNGTDDENLFRVCQTEERALITLDHDFGQTLRFPPKSSFGIAVLELPRRLNPQSIIARLKELLILIGYVTVKCGNFPRAIARTPSGELAWWLSRQRNQPR